MSLADSLDCFAASSPYNKGDCAAVANPALFGFAQVPQVHQAQMALQVPGAIRVPTESQEPMESQALPVGHQEQFMPLHPKALASQSTAWHVIHACAMHAHSFDAKPAPYNCMARWQPRCSALLALCLKSDERLDALFESAVLCCAVLPSSAVLLCQQEVRAAPQPTGL